MLYLHVLCGFMSTHWPAQDSMTQFRICKNLVILLTWYWVSKVMDFFPQFQSNPTPSKVIFALCVKFFSGWETFKPIFRVIMDFFFPFGYCISVLIAVHFTFNWDDLTQEWFVLFEFYLSIIWPSQSATASSFLLLGFVHFRHSRHEALWLWSNRDFLAAARSIKV